MYVPSISISEHTLWTSPFPASNRNNLTTNIKKLLEPIQKHLKLDCMCVSHTFHEDMAPKEHKTELRRCLGNHGVVVANYTPGMINKLTEMIAEMKGRSHLAFVLIKDESDMFDRTPEDAEVTTLNPKPPSTLQTKP